MFRKAIESVTEEQVQKGSPELKNLYDGLVMTETQLLSVSICILDRGWADKLRLSGKRSKDKSKWGDKLERESLKHVPVYNVLPFHHFFFPPSQPQVFRRHGLEQIKPVIGEKFDPSQQEAMFELPLPDKKPGTVAHTVRLGWTLHSRCIRSAQVGVVKDN